MTKSTIWRISHFHFCLRLFNLDPVIQVSTEKSGNKAMVFSPCMSGCSRTTVSAWSEMDSMALKLKCSLQTNQYFDYGSVTFNISAKSNDLTNWLLKTATVEFSSERGSWTTEAIVGKHHPGAKLQKLRCSQQSALHFAKPSCACGTLCVFRLSYLQAVRLQQKVQWSREQRSMLCYSYSYSCTGSYGLGVSVLCGHSQSENSSVWGIRGGVAGPILFSKSVFKLMVALFLSLVQPLDQPT